MKKILPCCFLLIAGCFAVGNAQNRMVELLKERDALYQQYDAYLSENNALFGGKSKKDLNNLIATLKGIIAKDNEIIREVRMTGMQKESNYVGQNRENTTRLYDLERNIGALRTQLIQRERILTERREDVKHLEATIGQLRLAVLALTGGVLVLLVYIFQLRRAKVRRA